MKGLAELGEAVMLEGSWSKEHPEDGRVKLEETIEVTFSPQMEGEISGFQTASVPRVLMLWKMQLGFSLSDFSMVSWLYRKSLAL